MLASPRAAFYSGRMNPRPRRLGFAGLLLVAGLLMPDAGCVRVGGQNREIRATLRIDRIRGTDFTVDIQ